MRFTEVFRALGRSVVYYPSMNAITGSVTATIFLSNLLMWEGSQDDPERWIYKTQKDMEKETGLTRHEQDGARKRLRDAGFVEEKLRGIPAKTHYRLDIDAINDAWEDALANNVAEIRQSVARKSGKQRSQETTDYLLTEETTGETHDVALSANRLRLMERERKRMEGKR